MADMADMADITNIAQRTQQAVAKAGTTIEYVFEFMDKVATSPLVNPH